MEMVVDKERDEWGSDFEFCDFICMTQNNDVIVMIQLLIWLGADLEHIWTIIVNNLHVGSEV